MPFKRRILPVSDRLYDTLDQRYANINHNHDTVYSKLGHTHTADQVVGMVGLWDQRSLAVEPCYGTCGQIYEVIQNGWLRISMNAHQGVMVLTTPLSAFDQDIREYSSYGSGYRFEAWSVIVKHNGSYWLVRSTYTSSDNGANNDPGGSSNRWMSLPSWVPCVGIAHCMAVGEGDGISGSLIVPCRAGEQYAYLSTTLDDRSIARQCRGYNYSGSDNRCYFQYLPYVYQKERIGLRTIEDRRLTDNYYRYNQFENILTGTPVQYRL